LQYGTCAGIIYPYLIEKRRREIEMADYGVERQYIKMKSIEAMLATPINKLEKRIYKKTHAEAVKEFDRLVAEHALSELK